eukprot:6212500-Pleurochrysis_carterae.AAC.2
MQPPGRLPALWRAWPRRAGVRVERGDLRQCFSGPERREDAHMGLRISTDTRFLCWPLGCRELSSSH